MNKFVLLSLTTLSACASPTPQQETRLTEVLTVACKVDGTIVPLAQPIVAAMGTVGATASNADLMVHPAVVAACQALQGVPASVTTITPVTTAAAAPPTPSPAAKQP